MQNSNKDLCIYRVQTAIEKIIGRMLAQLQLKREKSDYDDFYVISKEEADIQYQNAEIILTVVRNYLTKEYEIVV